MMKNVRLFFICFIFMSFTFPARAAEINTAITETKNQIDQYVNELKRFRAKTAEERIKLNNEISDLQAEVVELRKEDRFLQSFILEKDLGFERLKERANQQQEELRFIYTQTSEFRRSMPKRMSLAQELKFKEAFTQIDNLFDPSSAKGMLQSTPPLLDLIQKSLTDSSGGDVFKGSALDKDGKLYEGKFISLGPIEYFVSDNKQISGLIGISTLQLRPEVIFTLDFKKVNSVLSGQKQSLPMDVTGGDAIKIEQKQAKSLLAEIKAGGVVMWPILGLFIVCLMVALFKTYSLLQLNVRGGFTLGRILTLINQNKIEEAKDRVDQMKRPLAPVLHEGIEHRNAPKEHIEEIMHEQVLSQVPFLEKGLPILAVSAAAAPLLGLLGTVMGMLETFESLSQRAQETATQVSGGVRFALVTTQAGLMVAIPAIFIIQWSHLPEFNRAIYH
jgi:biopolymer transport protein ExbB